MSCLPGTSPVNACRLTPSFITSVLEAPMNDSVVDDDVLIYYAIDQFGTVEKSQNKMFVTCLIFQLFQID